MAQIICQCKEVSRDEILAVIREEKPGSLAELIMKTGAGAGCGRCIPVLRLLLRMEKESLVLRNSGAGQQQ